MAFYNPRSASRPDQFARTLEILQEECGPDRLILFARAVSTADQVLRWERLGEARPEMADMRTVVILGNSRTRRVAGTGFVYTPRSA
jgi:precorrin-3B C17-methyltransferase